MYANLRNSIHSTAIPMFETAPRVSGKSPSPLRFAWQPEPGLAEEANRVRT